MINLKEIKARLDAATPGPYDSRCYNGEDIHALPEVWTEFGWLRELPRAYRVPTVEMLAHAPQDIAALIEALEKCSVTIKTVLKKYNINHYGKCDVRDKLPCSCGRDEIIQTLKEVFGE